MDKTDSTKLRLGGMALQNGILVHGPTSWAAAVRDRDGQIRVATGPKRTFGANLSTPLIRGALRLAEAMAVLPDVKRRLPEAKFAFERPRVAVAVVGASVLGSLARRSSLSLVTRESAAALASLVPAVVALRGGELAAYHGAEHVSIGEYEIEGPAAKEHERCGSHLVGPLLVTSAATSVLTARLPARHRRVAQLAGNVAAVGAAVEIVGWGNRNPERRLAKLLARPGHELQRRLATADPSPAQLEVAEVALAACLRAEEEKVAERSS